MTWSQNLIDSLIQITRTKSDTQAVLACHELGKLLVAEQIDSSYLYLQIGADLCEKLNYQRGKILIWRSLGSVEARRGNYEASKGWTRRGLAMIEAENLPIINRVDYLINLGVADYFKGDIGSALEPHIEAVEICRANNFDEKRAKLLNNIGIFYRQLERYDEAIGFYKEGIELRQQHKDTAGMANLYHNMAAAYSFLGDYENSLGSASRSRTLYEALDSKPDLLLCDLSIGTALQRLGRLQEAKTYLFKLDQIKDLSLPPHHTFLLALSLAELFLSENDPGLANMKLNNIEKDLFASDFKDFQIKWFEMRSEAMERMGKLGQANKSLHDFINATEEKSKRENAALRNEMEAKYLSQEKDYQIELLNSEKELASVNLKIAKQRNIGLLLGLLFLGGLSFVLINLYQKIKKQNVQITKADEEKSVLLKEIHHRVKNNLQVISALLQLQTKYVNDDHAVEALQSGQDRVESMALIHKDLYQHDNLKGVNTKDYIDKLVDGLSDSYQTEQRQIEIVSDIEPIILDVDTMIPLGLLVNELISNAIKHAFINQDKGKIKVHLAERNDILNLAVIDNGQGVEDLEAIKSKSFGFSLIQSFAKKLDAAMILESNEGFRVELNIRAYSKAKQAA